jgi:serine/threonine-protein kinase
MASVFPSLDGKYEILEKLHEGGMGAIYKVRHRLLDEVRVIKVMRAQHESDDGLRARFLREAQVAVKLRHQHIAQMYDFAFDDAGHGFIVMEYVEGISLQELLVRVGAPSLGLSLELARQALTALGFLHRKGIVHRDISPDNVMAAQGEDGKPFVKLIDLGIAKVLASGTGLTVTGTFLGKLRYASPEQFGAAGTAIDQRSDIYSFGVMLYELSTGTHPVPGDTPQQMIAGHLVRPPLDFAKSDPAGRVPEDFRAIVLKAMAKNQNDRFQAVEALDQALAEVQARFPLSSDELTRALQQGAARTTTIQVPAPGSTQDRINAQFGMGATPRPISLVGIEDARGTAPTVPFLSNTAGSSDVAAPGAAPAHLSSAEAGVLPAPGGSPPQGTHPTLILPEGRPKPAPKSAVQPPAAGGLKASGTRRAPWPLLVAGGAIVVAAALGASLVLSHRKSETVGQQPAAAPQTPPTFGTAEAPSPATQKVAQPAPPARPAADVADIERAIAAGNVEQVRTFLAGLSKDDRAAIEANTNGKKQLDLAGRAVEADTALAKATRAKDWATAVQQASTLAAVLPASRQAKQARETAAAALEAEADAALRKGGADAALGKLEALKRIWPDRPGLEARVAEAHSAKEADQRLAAALAAGDAAEKERRPEKGLEALEQVTPDARWQERFTGTRLRLEGLLSELDKAPPAIQLKPGFKLDYSKGTVVTVPLLVSDDYRVKSVSVMARRDGTSEFHPLPVKATGADQYTVEITPDFHGNKTVELYVVADDFAGHTTRLGSPEQPLRLKKRGLF